MTDRRTVLGALAGAALGLAALPAAAQEVTLKLHQFLPAQANVPKLVLDVWADNVEAASEGRIAIERYPSMQLGGAPPELYDQVVDGVADIAWVVPGFTPGRFPTTETFELPFMVDDARAASAAYWQLQEEAMADETPGAKVLAAWVHGPGVIHVSDPVETPADLEGMKIRGGSRMVTQLLELTGAEPIGMPVTQIPESLSKGVIDGTTIPWEVTGALKTSELVEFHTEFEDAYLYTLTFLLVMNQEVYDGLPDDLRQIVDEQSGLAFSIFAGGQQADADAPARELAVEAGNEITVVGADAQAEWRETVQPIYDTWVGEIDAAGRDGQALIDRAKELMEAYDDSMDTYGPL